jgi:hypothetical protein
MARQPTAWKHGATARFQNHPLKQAEFEQLCVELQAEYRAKERSELELIKNLATEFMRAEHNAVAEQAKLEQVNLHSQLTSQPLDEMDGNLGVKMRYARNVEAGVYDFRADRAEEVFLRGLANTMLISREIASLTNRKQEGSLKAIIEETDRLGLQLRAILADSEVNPALFTTYLGDRPHLLSEILHCQWVDYDDSRFTVADLPDTRDERLARLMEQLMMDCMAEQLAYQMHRHLCQYNELRPRLVTLPDAEAETYRRYATSSTNAISKLIKTLRETVNERERHEAYVVSSA